VLLVALAEELADWLLESIVIAAHEAILAALTAGDPQQSRDAMEAHMNQTQADLRRYVLDAGQP